MLAILIILIIIILFIASPFAFFWTYRRPVGPGLWGFAGRGLVAGLVSWSLLIVPLGLFSGFFPYLLYYFPILPYAALTGIVLTLAFRLVLNKAGIETRGIIRALLGAAAGVLLGGVIGLWFGHDSPFDPWGPVFIFGFLIGFAGFFSGIMAGEASS